MRLAPRSVVIEAILFPIALAVVVVVVLAWAGYRWWTRPARTEGGGVAEEQPGERRRRAG
ncbi:MAG TPA: hypothetical protein VNN07_00395 [Candidatus Tectomicrobia bacterium]|nr:hypothetical protein [Candidatus Tectomicrobia bacterium]